MHFSSLQIFLIVRKLPYFGKSYLHQLIQCNTHGRSADFFEQSTDIQGTLISSSQGAILEIGLRIGIIP